MANSPLIREDLVVVSSWETLITEEMDCLILDAGNGLLRLNMLQAVGFIPAIREDIKRDLSTDRVSIRGECQEYYLKGSRTSPT